MKNRTVYVVTLASVFCLVFIISDPRAAIGSIAVRDNVLPEPDGLSQVKNDSKVYVSMGLCWKTHSNLYHKAQFPYEEAAR